MRRIFHNRDNAAAVVGVRTFLYMRQRFDRKAGFHERFIAVMTQADRKGELALCQSVGDLAEILTDEQLLLYELREIIFAFDFPEERPSVLSGAGMARIEKSDSSFPLGVQQIFKGANFLWLYLTGVIPKRLAGIALKGIDITLRLDVVLPDVATPPVLRIFDFRQNHVRLKIIRRSGSGHAYRRSPTGHQHVKIMHTGLIFVDNPRHVFRTAARKQLRSDAELFFEF